MADNENENKINLNDVNSNREKACKEYSKLVARIKRNKLDELVKEINEECKKNNPDDNRLNMFYKIIYDFYSNHHSKKEDVDSLVFVYKNISKKFKKIIQKREPFLAMSLENIDKLSKNSSAITYSYNNVARYDDEVDDVLKSIFYDFIQSDEKLEENDLKRLIKSTLNDGMGITDISFSPQAEQEIKNLCKIKNNKLSGSKNPQLPENLILRIINSLGKILNSILGNRYENKVKKSTDKLISSIAVKKVGPTIH